MIFRTFLILGDSILGESYKINYKEERMYAWPWAPYKTNIDMKNETRIVDDMDGFYDDLEP